jgi:hypothetical protein
MARIAKTFPPGGDPDPKIPCILFFSALLKDPKTFRTCPDSPVCVQSFFGLLCEDGHAGLLLRGVEAALSRLPEDEAVSGFAPFLQAFVSHVYRHPALVAEFSTVAAVVCEICPRMALRLLPLLDVLLRNANADSFPFALRLIGVASQADPDFRLSVKRWRILAAYLRPSDYLTLLSLIAGLPSLSLDAQFLITRPCFLSLMFVVLGSDRSQMDNFVSLCYNLAMLSERNLRMMHEGDVDAILLSSVINDGHARHFGFSFPVKVSRSVLLPLLRMIIATVTDHAVARDALKAAEITGDPVLISLLKNAVYQWRSELPGQFPIGILPPFGVVAGLSPDHFSGCFTVAFWLRADCFVTASSSVLMRIISVSDEKALIL